LRGEEDNEDYFYGHRFVYDIGDGCNIHPSVSVAMGFGYKREANGHLTHKEHKFGVKIGENVDIGAHTCIDIGRWRNTEIGEGTKIDNLVHISHNAHIGKHCIIGPHVSILGSVNIGDFCEIWTGAVIKQGVSIGHNSVIGANSFVNCDVPAGQVYVGNPAKFLRWNNEKKEGGGLSEREEEFKNDGKINE
jgi:UDP-3-O-[3-hydroxymyristoyl] glucosamine N-acyltransferase